MYLKVICWLQSFQMKCFVVARILPTSEPRSHSAIAELFFCKFWGLHCPFISQKWLKLELSNFIQRETTSSLAWGMTNHPQTECSWALTWPIFACATVDLEEFCHSMLLNEVNSAINGGPLLLRPSTVAYFNKCRVLGCLYPPFTYKILCSEGSHGMLLHA